MHLHSAKQDFNASHNISQHTPYLVKTELKYSLEH